MSGQFARATSPVGRKLQATAVQAVLLGSSQKSFGTAKGSDNKAKAPLRLDGNLNKIPVINKDNLPKWTSSRRLKCLPPEERNAVALSDQAVALLTKVSKKQMIQAAFWDKKAGLGKPRPHLGTSTAEECFGTMRAKSYLSPLTQFLAENKKPESTTPNLDDTNKFDYNSNDK